MHHPSPRPWRPPAFEPPPPHRPSPKPGLNVIERERETERERARERERKGRLSSRRRPIAHVSKALSPPRESRFSRARPECNIEKERQGKRASGPGCFGCRCWTACTASQTRTPPPGARSPARSGEIPSAWRDGMGAMVVVARIARMRA